MTGWAAGTLAIGIGVVPLAAGLASLFRARGETSTRELRAFRSIVVAALISFGLYTAIKAAFLSTEFATRVEERNLIYIAPLLFVGTALLLDRRRSNVWALAGRRGVHRLPRRLRDVPPDAVPVRDERPALLGRARARDPPAGEPLPPLDARVRARASCSRSSPPARSRSCSCRDCGRTASRRSALAAVLAVGIVGWTLTGEIAAAAGDATRSRREAAADASSTRSRGSTTATKGTADAVHGRGRGRPERRVDARVLEPLDHRASRASTAPCRAPARAGGPNLTADGSALLDEQPRGSRAHDTPTRSRTTRASTSPARSPARTRTVPAA